MHSWVVPAMEHARQERKRRNEAYGERQCLTKVVDAHSLKALTTRRVE